MKLLSQTQKSNGKRRVVVELDSDETIMAIKNGAHYKLGHPVCEVMAAHVISEAERVTWCSAGQEWQS